MSHPMIKLLEIQQREIAELEVKKKEIATKDSWWKGKEKPVDKDSWWRN